MLDQCFRKMQRQATLGRLPSHIENLWYEYPPPSELGTIQLRYFSMIIFFTALKLLA